jgi:REP element-mobilizing transposase RayT
MIGGIGKERKRLRLKDYDYSQPGAYLVTICTKDREHRFGEIADGEMRANAMAAVVESCWNDLSNHYPNIELDEFVVMPNHVHGIIVILDEPITVGECTVGDGLRPSPTRPSPTGSSPTKKHPLSEIDRAFKSFSARRINKICNTPGTPVWQRGYYDHIIRNERSLTRIREYITQNPQRWASDTQNYDSEGNYEFEHWRSSTGGHPVQEGT